MRWHKNQKLVFLSLLAMVAILSGLAYALISRYQSIINTGSQIADSYCIRVNPIIIAKRSKYIETLQIIQASGSAEAYHQKTQEYGEQSERYITELSQWLESSNAFMQRADFRLLTPHLIQEAGAYQHQARAADLEATRAVVELMKERTPERQAQLASQAASLSQKAGELEAAYNELWETGTVGFQPLQMFTKIPQSECPAENWNIPDVNDYLLPSPAVPVGPVG